MCDSLRVTAVVTTYDRPESLREALQSVLGQTRPPDEILVVDDGANPATQKTVNAVGEGRVRYHQNPTNLGLAASRNVGLELATGDLIAFLDDDDAWLPEKIERQVRVFEDGEERLGAVYGSVVYVYPDGTERVLQADARGDILPRLLRELNVVKGGFSGLLLRRMAVQAVGGFDPHLAMREDYELQLRLADAGYLFDFVPGAPTLRYRADGADSLSLKAGQRALGILQVFRKHRTLFESEPHARHGLDLMMAARFLSRAGHPRLALMVFRTALSQVHPTRHALRETLAVPMRIVADRVQASRNSPAQG